MTLLRFIPLQICLLVAAQTALAAGVVLTGSSAQCESLLADAAALSMRSRETTEVTAYLGLLLEQQTIGIRQLERMAEILDRGVLENPITEEEAAVDSGRLIHRGGFEDLLKRGEIDREALKAWISGTLKAKGIVRVKREETRTATQDLHRKMKFVAVSGGKFLMGEEGVKVEVELTHQIEVMSTLVTQKMWVERMGVNPSHFKNGEYSITKAVSGKQVRMQPDHPVENITWWSAILFANKLSEEKGLKPAYDVSGIRWKKGTTAEAGTLNIEIGKFKINASDGDIYQAEGFRIPTEAEQEFLLRAVGTANGNYHFGSNEAELAEYAWQVGNSERTTHPVAEKKALVIGEDRKEIFDLDGNVSEWGHDWVSERLESGKNPQGPTAGSFRVFRGGGWGNDARILRSARRSSAGPGNRSSVLGFRLVRTIP